MIKLKDTGDFETIPEIINDIIEKIFKTCSVIIFLVGIIYSINLL